MYNCDNIFKRIRGVLIGVALGDAMGMPTELCTQSMIAEEFPNGILDFVPSFNKGVIERNLKAAQITDDTINTILVLETICSCNGEIITTEYINKLLEWSQNSTLSHLVSGPSTQKALTKIKNGDSISDTGKFGTTNGAAMKITPIGIISDHNNLNQLVKSVQKICMPTHNTNIAIAGASAIAAIISYVISGKNNINEIYDLAHATIDIGLLSGYNISSPNLHNRIDLAREIVENNTLEKAITKLYEIIGTGVETIETIPSVLAVVQLSNGDPLKAAQISASLGGDTDTIGSISCAICGGMNPEFEYSIINKLEVVNSLDFNDLTNKILNFCPYK